METEKCWGVVNSYGDVIYWTVTEKSPEEAWAIFTNIWPEKIKGNWISRVARNPRTHVISKFKEWIVTSPTPLEVALEKASADRNAVIEEVAVVVEQSDIFTTDETALQAQLVRKFRALKSATPDEVEGQKLK